MYSQVIDSEVQVTEGDEVKRADRQSESAIMELSMLELVLVGGGDGSIVLA